MLATLRTEGVYQVWAQALPQGRCINPNDSHTKRGPREIAMNRKMSGKPYKVESLSWSKPYAVENLSWLWTLQLGSETG